MVPKKIFRIQKGTPSFFSPIFCEFKSGLIFGFGQKLIHPRDFYERMSEKALKGNYGENPIQTVIDNTYMFHSTVIIFCIYKYF